MAKRENHIATPADWRAASRADRLARAERLSLPSGAVILAVKPEPIEWIISGRLPQRLLGAVLSRDSGAAAEVSREEVLELARFATQLVQASIVDPSIGDGPDDILLEDIPLKDRAFIFQWACRTFGEDETDNTRLRGQAVGPHCAAEEDLSSASLERFCQK